MSAVCSASGVPHGDCGKWVYSSTASKNAKGSGSDKLLFPSHMTDARVRSRDRYRMIPILLVQSTFALPLCDRKPRALRRTFCPFSNILSADFPTPLCSYRTLALPERAALAHRALNICKGRNGSRRFDCVRFDWATLLAISPASYTAAARGSPGVASKGQICRQQKAPGVLSTGSFCRDREYIRRVHHEQLSKSILCRVWQRCAFTVIMLERAASNISNPRTQGNSIDALNLAAFSTAIGRGEHVRRAAENC